jgi:hypothetical protein
MPDDLLEWLQLFYSRLCDGDWEHSYGFEIGNLDNPGWHIDFDLADTKLQRAPFTPVKLDRSEHDWVFCSVKDGKFVGDCGPRNLKELLMIFREWVETHIGSEEVPWSDESV